MIGFCPVFYGFVRFSPVLLLRKPHALIFELKGREAKAATSRCQALILSGEIGMPRVTPLLTWRNRDELTRHYLPGAR